MRYAIFVLIGFLLTNAWLLASPAKIKPFPLLSSFEISKQFYYFYLSIYAFFFLYAAFYAFEVRTFYSYVAMLCMFIVLLDYVFVYREPLAYLSYVKPFTDIKILKESPNGCYIPLSGTLLVGIILGLNALISVLIYLFK